MVVSASSPIFFSWGLKNPLLRSFFPEMRDDEGRVVARGRQTAVPAN